MAPQLTDTQIAKLLSNKSVGRWTKNGMDRIYINGLLGWSNTSLSHYNTGNISHAAENGETISNCEGRRRQFHCDNLKIWYDITTGEFCSKGGSDGYKWLTEEIIANVIKTVS